MGSARNWLIFQLRFAASSEAIDIRTVAPNNEYRNRYSEQEIPNIVFPTENCELKHTEQEQESQTQTATDD